MKNDVQSHIALAAEQITASGAEIVSGASRIRGRLGGRPSLLIIGCGDSLAAAELALRDGHQAMSAGDVAWGGAGPRPGQAVVALSVSGATSATVTAAAAAKAAGAPVVAITAGEASPLATIADHLVLVPKPPACASVPAGGFLTMGLAVAGLIGAATDADPAILAARLDALVAVPAGAGMSPTSTLPAAVSVCSLPELQAARRFWTLKFIEAAGRAARSVPLEEWGHVDYFIGEQPHLDLVLLGSDGRERAASLAQAMSRVGHDHRVFDTAEYLGPAGETSGVLINLVAGAAGALYADDCARAWGRAPFRGGAVDMSAAHIQGPSVAAS